MLNIHSRPRCYSIFYEFIAKPLLLVRSCPFHPEACCPKASIEVLQWGCGLLQKSGAVGERGAQPHCHSHCVYAVIREYSDAFLICPAVPLVDWRSHVFSHNSWTFHATVTNSVAYPPKIGCSITHCAWVRSRIRGEFCSESLQPVTTLLQICIKNRGLSLEWVAHTPLF